MGVEIQNLKMRGGGGTSLNNITGKGRKESIVIV